MADSSLPSETASTRTPIRRKSTGKRLRFEVFKRDYFTCQYCGAQPPDAVLVVDHIVPVAAGGTSTIDNLITACEPCNQGKADKPLGDRMVRPDADLLYLETQQEIAEHRRFIAAQEELDQSIRDLISYLQDAWCEVSGLDWHPSDNIVRQLVKYRGVEIAQAAMEDVALKFGSGYLKSYNKLWPAYLNAVARNMAGDE